MKQYHSLQQHKKNILSDTKVRIEFKALQPRYAIIRSLIKKRIQKNMTQSQLANKVGTKQSAIARFESGTTNPTIQFLTTLAHALGATLKVTLTNK